MIKAVYAGTFDPITKGHAWVVREAKRIFDELTIAIAVNPTKKYMFSLDERKELIVGTFGLNGFDAKNVKLATIGNEFLVDWANDHGCTHLVRGIRNETDFEYEHAMLNINRDRLPSIETVFLIPPRELCETSSSMVKGLVGVNGWKSLVRNYADEHVIAAFEKKLASR